MVRRRLVVWGVLSALVVGGAGARGQERPDPAKLIAAQKEAMAPLAYMDGVWRGTAWTMLPSGEKHTITQTERIGPFLDGSVKVIEGRGYEPDGKVSFNAFGTISFDAKSGTYTLHSHAMGQVGDFSLKPTADGYTWEIPAGPMTIRYTATVKNGKWTEVGDRIMGDQKPIRFFEMTLQRIGDTDWPAAGAIPPK
jgi:hypothetical protein